MDLLLWITISLIVIEFIVLISMKKGMESKLAFIKANMEDEESTTKAKSIIWWIWGTAAWGIVSMFLVLCWFAYYFG
ncbi:hypothetical protein [Oceanobacillus sp. FSL H7-0719]|uniref:hypothetical protein n=1 Tax=Oceanobacillus sp. FSL H7-0719 TaxID=2954507 RepID=UPI0032431174